MKHDSHIEAFEERKETILKWGVETRGIERSQRIIGDNASKAIVELLSAYLHKKRKIDEGFQINHTWFKSERVFERFPEFENKESIIERMMKLEDICEGLSYGIQKPVERMKRALGLFEELEDSIKRMMQ